MKESSNKSFYIGCVIPGIIAVVSIISSLICGGGWCDLYVYYLAPLIWIPWGLIMLIVGLFYIYSAKKNKKPIKNILIFTILSLGLPIIFIFFYNPEIIKIVPHIPSIVLDIFL